MHVGGRSASLDGLPPQEIRFSPGGPLVRIDPNGDFEIEQMYVQYVRLSRPRARHPLLLMHGGGLCGAMYETKPDGRPGWQRWFLQAGHDVFVADAVERGRASWARSPQFFQGEPVFRTKAAREEEQSIEDWAHDLLDYVGIGKYANYTARNLSYGHQRRLEIARALATQPRFILLDEPFAGVDPIAVIDIQRIIGYLRQRGIGVLITDHNVRETLGICDRAYIISEGTVLAEGTPQDIVANPQVRRVYLGEHFRM
jgi:ABC-type dipeptide/oligopeptide/nickel transport system ATPase component